MWLWHSGSRRDANPRKSRRASPFIVSRNDIKASPAAARKLALGHVLAQRYSGVVRCRRVRPAADATEQVRADGVKEPVIAQVETVHDGQRRVGALDFGQRNGAVQRYDGTGRDDQMPVVQRQDLPPVRSIGSRSIAVHGVDRRLDLIRAGPAPGETLPNDRPTFRHEVIVPESAMLVPEQHHRPIGQRSRRAARFQ